MTRNYKTGPPRSRRRPDPAQTAEIFQGMFVRLPQAVVFGSTINIPLRATDWLDGNEPPPDSLYLTGQPTRAVLIDSMGTVHQVTNVTLNSAFNDVTYQVPAGPVATGTASFRVPPFDRVARGVKGEWLAPYEFEFTVT